VSQLDEVEYSRLAAQVQEIEKLVNSGQPGDVGLLLKSFLYNAKSRMEEIRHDEVRVEDEKKNHKTNETSTAVQLAEMEHKLNADEKQQYSGFLKLDYFTKPNFDDLEDFYANSWDKLSEGGKNQMSARIWEGIKRHEYTFEELPEKVREKESERMYLQLTGKIEPSASLQKVPAQDRADFVREYEAGNEQGASKILSRPAFAEYSPDTRNVSSFEDDTSTKGKAPEGQERSSLAAGQDAVVAAKLSASGISQVTDTEDILPPAVGGGGQVNTRG
jgi:hypothetical protein